MCPKKKSKSCSASTAAAGHDFRGANKGRDDPAVSHEEDRERKLESVIEHTGQNLDCRSSIPTCISDGLIVTP